MRQLLFFAALFIITPSFSQTYVTVKTVTGKAKKLYDEAMNLVPYEKYDEAAECLQKALDKEPTFIDARIQLAGVHYDKGDFAAAEKGFEEALTMDRNYKSTTLYKLAHTKRQLDKYDEAIALFEEFLAKEKRMQRTRNKAQYYIESSRFAAAAVANPVPFEPKNLGASINTEHDEYFPALTADESTFIFTRNQNRNEDFYTSEKIDGKWKVATPIETINTIYNEGAVTISADGKFLVFTACDLKDGKGGCDLYFSEKKNGDWTKPKNMGESINTVYWDSQPSLSANADALYFSSTRNGSNGREADLYVSYRENGQWTSPKNLGVNINTKEEEATPFIHPDGQTLYFMSKGHPGMGGYDLFLSRRNADGTWGKPENLGYPINTKADEADLIISLDGKTAYFASDREDFGEAQGKIDLYSFELAPQIRPKAVTYVQATVSDITNGHRLEAEINFVDLTTGKTFMTGKTERDGKFLTVLPAGKNYALNVSKDGYLFYSQNFDIQGLTNIDEPFKLKIELTPINETIAENEAAKPIILQNIFFETGSAELLPTSVSELTRLQNLLEKNPNLRIQINGHTDNVGSDADNLTLSTNRAKSVYNWLLEKGIEVARLKFKGFGEMQPIETNETTEGRQSNRRTEFQVW